MGAVNLSGDFARVAPRCDSINTMATIAFDRITVNPGQCDGKPCIRGLRIPVHLILRLLSNGKSNAEIIDAYPELTAEDIRQAIEYAAWLANEKTIIVPAPPK